MSMSVTEIWNGELSTTVVRSTEFMDILLPSAGDKHVVLAYAPIVKTPIPIPLHFPIGTVSTGLGDSDS